MNYRVEITIIQSDSRGQCCCFVARALVLLRAPSVEIAVWERHPIEGVLGPQVYSVYGTIKAILG